MTRPEIQLNANQRKAVEWDEGPLLVLAGPGSGKTLVLTRRIARLIQESPQRRFGVLGLTFTTQAADEMRVRVAQLLGREDRRTRLTTFHSFATRVLRQHGSHLGLRPNFQLLADADRVGVLSKVTRTCAIQDVPRSDRDLRRILSTIDDLYREACDWEEAVDQFPLRGSSKEWVAPVYSAYVDVLVRNNYLDFGALLVCCIRLFRQRPQIAEFYRKLYPFACVDEYQDTNRAQGLILRAVYGDQRPNLFVVADDDQTIFRWNGVELRRVWKLAQHYRMKMIQLPESYRCPPRVVEVANRLIQHRLQPGAEQMIVKEPMAASPVRDEPGTVVARRFGNQEDEMAWVARDIANRSLSPGSCVVLARRKKLAETVAEALSRTGLATYLGVRKDEFSSARVRFAHSALKLANAPNDGEQLSRLCEAFAVLAGERIRPGEAEAESNLSGGPLLGGFVEAASAGVGESGRSILGLLGQHLVDALDYRAFVDALFRWMPREEDFFERVVDPAEDEEERRVWRQLERKAKSTLGTVPTLSQLLHEFAVRSKATPPTAEQVQCLTIHGAKGKEFKHVYLVGLAEGELPSYYATRRDGGSVEGRHAMDEERRLCFVAITRASGSVTLTYADSYFGWRKEPSRFLAEMGLVSESNAFYYESKPDM